MNKTNALKSNLTNNLNIKLIWNTLAQLLLRHCSSEMKLFRGQ